MKTATKLAAFALVLAAVFTAAWAIGSAAGPLHPDQTTTTTNHDHSHQ